MSSISARQKIVEAAQHLMTARGYSGTTVDEIVKLAGVAKGSFYHAFASKEELAIAALEDYEAAGSAILANGPYMQVTDPVARAKAFLDFVESSCQALWSHGCLLGSVAIEVADNYPDVIKSIDTLFRDFEARLEQIFEPALQARGITHVTARELSVHFLGVIEGSIIVAKSHFTPEYLNKGIQLFREYLVLLLDQDRT